eukprot:CAMPEP_0115096290 /NCGR_PEP_ID=MMETSP0227-20121206/29626_1 /TAXON_ID=89957 /ORGANISM="Polarella glacialis, Strain CCMP 1383" /LENGTH=663 /DNA_ID=CAMNT_0002489977 /DNA_START=73 /DNA_END=2064 /DNA_ORIENTATION=-
MFRRLDSALEGITQRVQREAEYISRTAKDSWNDVAVRCPNCRTDLKVPARAKMFTCSSCGTNINDPGIGSRLSCHIAKIQNACNTAVSTALGDMVPVPVTVPAGAMEGALLEIPCGLNATIHYIRLPPGMQPGQTFVAQVPKSLFAEATVCAWGEVAVAPGAPPAAPLASPVAAEQQSQESTSEIAAPSAPTEELALGVGPSARTIVAEQPAGADVSGVEGRLNDVKRRVEGEIRFAEKAIGDVWNHVVVQCPTCSTRLQVPAGMKVFSCTECGGNVNAPGLISQLSYHGSRFTRKFESTMNDMLRQTAGVNVTMPEGAQCGDTLTVRAGPSGGMCTVTIPEGLQVGQDFMVQVPLSLLSQEPDPASTTAAPLSAPVASALHEQLPAVTRLPAIASGGYSGQAQRAVSFESPGSSSSDTGVSASADACTKQSTEATGSVVTGRPPSEADLVAARPVWSSAVLDNPAADTVVGRPVAEVSGQEAVTAGHVAALPAEDTKPDSAPSKPLFQGPENIVDSRDAGTVALAAEIESQPISAASPPATQANGGTDSKDEIVAELPAVAVSQPNGAGPASVSQSADESPDSKEDSVPTAVANGQPSTEGADSQASNVAEVSAEAEGQPTSASSPPASQAIEGTDSKDDTVAELSAVPNGHPGTTGTVQTS